jgi:hypothetical protein
MDFLVRQRAPVAYAQLIATWLHSSLSLDQTGGAGHISPSLLGQTTTNPVHGAQEPLPSVYSGRLQGGLMFIQLLPEGFDLRTDYYRGQHKSRSGQADLNVFPAQLLSRDS